MTTPTLDLTAIAAELRGLRDSAPGVTDSLVATVDGLLVAADAAEQLDTDTLCAVAAVDLGLAKRATSALGFGAFAQTTVSGSGGHLACYPVGGLAVLVVLGDGGADLAAVHPLARDAATRIRALLPTTTERENP